MAAASKPPAPTISTVPLPAGTSRSYHKELPPFSQRSTIVIGGFAEETRGTVIQEAIEAMKRNMDGVTTTWAPTKRGSIGKVSFQTPGHMWAYVKSMKGKKIQHESKDYWFTVEKTPQERAMAKKVNVCVKLLREKLQAAGEDVEDKDILDADWNRGYIWVHSQKVVAPNPARTSPEVQEDKWAAARMPVDILELKNALQ